MRLRIPGSANRHRLTATVIAWPLLCACSIGLSWTAPTENEDDTPLTDLCCYRVHSGRETGDYTRSQLVYGTNARTGCWARGQWFVAVTALDRAGNESGYSNEITVQAEGMGWWPAIQLLLD